jgi:hypothetical protein
VTSVAYSPDGKRIVSGSHDNTLKVWDAQTGQDLLALRGHTGWVTSVAYSPNAKRIVSGSLDNTLKVWDAPAGQDLLFLKGHTSAVTSVAFSRNGKRVFGRDERGKVLAWDAANGMLLPDAPSAIPASRSVAVHGNRRACADGNLVRIERILSPDEQQRLRREEERTQRLLDIRARREFHTAQAEAAEQGKQPFAAVFHLDRLLVLLPGERRKLLERRHAVLAAALTKTPGDTWATRALAQQAIPDPDSIPDR